MISFNKNQNKEAWQLLELGTSRLHKLIKEHPEASISLKEQYLEEKKAWDVYYNILDRMEKALGEGDSFALAMKVKAEKLIRGCEIDL